MGCAFLDVDVAGNDVFFFCTKSDFLGKLKIADVRGCMHWDEKTVMTPTGLLPARIGSALFFRDGIIYGKISGLE